MLGQLKTNMIYPIEINKQSCRAVVCIGCVSPMAQKILEFNYIVTPGLCRHCEQRNAEKTFDAQNEMREDTLRDGGK